MRPVVAAQGSRLMKPVEWRWLAVGIVLVILVTSAPYAMAWACRTPDEIFSGFNFLLDDAFSYLAKMRQGADGAWLFHIAYTPEPHPGAFFFPFHMLLGRLATLLPGDDLTAKMVWVYHGARVLFGSVLLLTTYRFIARFTARTAVRRLAWLIVALGGGLGWLLVLLGRYNWLGDVPLDLYLPEGFAYLILYGSPHIALAQSLLFWGVLFILKTWEAEQGVEPPNPGYTTRDARSPVRTPLWTRAVLAGLMWLVMGLVVPFYVAVIWAVMGAAWSVLVLRNHRIMWRGGSMLGIAVLISAPVIAYNLWVFNSEPVYATWAAQNLILSPHPLHYAAAYGVLLILAAFAAGQAWRDQRPAWFALAWVGVAPVLVYLPVNLQRRLVQGVQVPLGLLAAMGAIGLWESRRRWPIIRRALVGILLAAIAPTSLLFLATSGAWMLSRPPLVFRDRAEIEALEWLADQAGLEEVVLASYETGNYLPARVGTRVFLGHGLETVNADEKQAQVMRFFDETTQDTWREQVLAQYGVDYVFWGPLEQTLGGFDPRQAPYLRPAYEHEGYAVFEVR